jgi:hypothetical protein
MDVLIDLNRKFYSVSIYKERNVNNSSVDTYFMDDKLTLYSGILNYCDTHLGR